MSAFQRFGDLLLPVPWIALPLGAFFLIAWSLRRNHLLLVAGTVWPLYFVYEYLNYKRITCSGECDIRVDLLVIHPALLILTVVAVAVLIASLLKKAPSAT